jgi:hypothetical protein
MAAPETAEPSKLGKKVFLALIEVSGTVDILGTIALPALREFTDRGAQSLFVGLTVRHQGE